MSKVWTEQDTSGNERLVLMALADNANDEGICWPSHATIASKCRIERRHVIRLVQSLINRGYVRRQRRLAKDGRKTSNIYQLLPGNFNILGPLASDSQDTSDVTPRTLAMCLPGHYPSDSQDTILVTPESHKPSVEPSILTTNETAVVEVKAEILPATAAAENLSESNLAELKKWGIGKNKTIDKLVQDPTITPEIIAANAERLINENRFTTGLLITTLKCGDDPPSIPKLGAARDAAKYSDWET